MNEQSMDILERIRASYYQLTAAERKVADYVLTQHSQVQFMSITQLADECGTAETTVTRFCRSLKLKGFNAFKIELARHSVLGASSRREPVSTDTLAGRVRESGRLAIDAVHQTTELMDLNQIGLAVELIEQAPTVLCLGSGATTGGIQILELARQRGIRTILVTRFQKSPAAKLSEVVLCCGSNESPFQFGSVPAKVAQLVVIDVFFQEYCLRNQESCNERVQYIASALSALHI